MNMGGAVIGGAYDMDKVRAGGSIEMCFVCTCLCIHAYVHIYIHACMDMNMGGAAACNNKGRLRYGQVHMVRERGPIKMCFVCVLGI